MMCARGPVAGGVLGRLPLHAPHVPRDHRRRRRVRRGRTVRRLRGGPRRAGVRGAARRGHGKAVRVNPFKSMLKAPGTQRLKLQYGEPPSKSAFKLCLRRYNMAEQLLLPEAWDKAKRGAVFTWRGAGAYTCPLFRST